MRVRFPAYRRFAEARIAANDAMMALLIGSRLGEHALDHSAASPDARLPELFGQIDGIQRVNRTASDAAALLRDAERHLAYMAIPYALSVHTAFVSEAAIMLRADGRDDAGANWTISYRSDLYELQASIAHEYVAERCSARLPEALLEIFHLARRIRNRIVHFAGRCGDRLPGEYRGLSPPARASWEHLSKRSLTLMPDGVHLDLAEGELIAVLRMSHRLAQAVNELLVATLSRSYWASVVVQDYSALYPQRFGERDQRLRRLRNFARRSYQGLQLTDEELQAAAEEE